VDNALPSVTCPVERGAGAHTIGVSRLSSTFDGAGGARSGLMRPTRPAAR